MRIITNTGVFKMKIYQKFKPIIIELETQEEAKSMYEVSGWNETVAIEVAKHYYKEGDKCEYDQERKDKISKLFGKIFKDLENYT